MAAKSEPPRKVHTTTAADILGVSKHTVLRYIELGILPAARFTANGWYLIDREDLREFQSGKKKKS